ncbi:hypothetical protein M5D96_012942 [Drosophila gunungcola]|uniref:Uncharacterized protein n=1 Tax=Drosophila gunungcola TaxID=103775 RepID=A0A9P9YC89_9MUSC|nr:hypothetical protein M5D96_012942 [Drosophila gunungcola]
MGNNCEKPTTQGTQRNAKLVNNCGRFSSKFLNKIIHE